MNSRVVAVVVVVGLTLGACGGDAGPDTTAVVSDTTIVEQSPPADSVEGPSESTTTTTPAAAPPTEDSGVVTWGGETYELAGGDFFLCETVNPAFEGDFNIQTRLDETDFSLMGNVDDYSADHQGLRLGSLPDEEKATDLELTLEGRNLSGQAQTTQGPIEFSFDC